jgi:tetratricopeptide (TPR) repeat protein
VKVWDARTGKDLLTLKGHTAAVTGVAVSADGKRVVSAGADKTAKVWDARTGRLRLTVKAASGALGVAAVSADGSRIVSTRGAALEVWDARTGQVLRTLGGKGWPVRSVAVSADGSRVLSGSVDRTWALWDADTGGVVLTFPEHRRSLESVVFSADGKRVFGKVARTGRVIVWSAATGKRLPEGPAEMPTLGGEVASPDCRVRATLDGALLIVLRPELAQARRLRQARDRERLLRLANFERGWHLDALHAAVQAGDDVAAAFHLGRLLGAEPWDASLHIRQAHVLARLGRRRESVTHLMHALFINPRVSLWPIDPTAAQRGERAAQAGDWPRVVEAFRLGLHQPQAPATALVQLLMAQAAAGDRAGTRQTVAEMARRWPAEKDARATAALLHHALLVPWDKSAERALLGQARRNLARQRNAVTLHHYGAALYRSRRYAEAERTLAESVKLHGKGGFADTWPFQALAARRRGKHDEAAGLLARLEGWHRGQTFPTW